MAAELKEPQDLKESKIFTCLVCLDEFKDAPMCPDEHCICTSCIKRSIDSNGGTPDNTLKCQHRVYGQPRDCGKKVNITECKDVKFMSLFALASYDRITELAETNVQLRAELNPKAQKNGNIALAESMALVYAHIKQTMESAVPMCPCCGTIVADFSGCVAITCSCKKFLCALCLKVFPTDQATHDHVLNDHNDEPGLRGFFTEEYERGNKQSGRGRTIEKWNRKIVLDSVFSSFGICADTFAKIIENIYKTVDYHEITCKFLRNQLVGKIDDAISHIGGDRAVGGGGGGGGGGGRAAAEQDDDQHDVIRRLSNHLDDERIRYTELTRKYNELSRKFDGYERDNRRQLNENMRLRNDIQSKDAEIRAITQQYDALLEILDTKSDVDTPKGILPAVAVGGGGGAAAVGGTGNIVFGGGKQVLINVGRLEELESLEPRLVETIQRLAQRDVRIDKYEADEKQNQQRIAELLQLVNEKDKVISDLYIEIDKMKPKVDNGTGRAVGGGGAGGAGLVIATGGLVDGAGRAAVGGGAGLVDGAGRAAGGGAAENERIPRADGIRLIPVKPNWKTVFCKRGDHCPYHIRYKQALKFAGGRTYVQPCRYLHTGDPEAEGRKNKYDDDGEFGPILEVEVHVVRIKP